MRYAKTTKDWVCSLITNGMTITRVAQDYKIHPNTIRKWMRSYNEPEYNHNECDLKLIQKYDNLLLEREELNKLVKSIELSKEKRFQIIHELRDSHSVSKMCSWLGVSESGYYKWRAKKP